eukprot:6218943-Alexandrium_andersonii.AAC.1
MGETGHLPARDLAREVSRAAAPDATLAFAIANRQDRQALTSSLPRSQLQTEGLLSAFKLFAA